jgi:hypothetical protein
MQSKKLADGGSRTMMVILEEVTLSLADTRTEGSRHSGHSA